MVVRPFKIAQETDVLLLGVRRRSRRISTPPGRSSQSTRTASNFDAKRISAPDLAAEETSTPIESLFERRPENADHFCVATDEQGLEVHGP